MERLVKIWKVGAVDGSVADGSTGGCGAPSVTGLGEEAERRLEEGMGAGLVEGKPNRALLAARGSDLEHGGFHAVARLVISQADPSLMRLGRGIGRTDKRPPATQIHKPGGVCEERIVTASPTEPDLVGQRLVARHVAPIERGRVDPRPEELQQTAPIRARRRHGPRRVINANGLVAHGFAQRTLELVWHRYPYRLDQSGFNGSSL